MGKLQRDYKVLCFRSHRDQFWFSHRKSLYSRSVRKWKMFKLICFFVLAMAVFAQHSIPDQRCPEINPHPAIKLPHESDCGLFYVCHFGNRILMPRCPVGLLFDEPSLQCLPEPVLCLKPVTTAAPPTTISIPTAPMETTTPRTTTSASTELTTISDTSTVGVSSTISYSTTVSDLISTSTLSLSIPTASRE